MEIKLKQSGKKSRNNQGNKVETISWKPGR